MTYTYTQAPPIPKHRPQEPKKYPTLSIKKVCAMIEERCGSVRITERHGRECGNYAVILPEAMQELTSIISYRRRSTSSSTSARSFSARRSSSTPMPTAARSTRFWSCAAGRSS